MPYCIYLRKSRADAEAELRGEGETLARHEKMLFDLAKKQHLDIVQIHREVVSGETISKRPVMQQLLVEVEQGLYDGVLVVEVERLARGDTIDQGIVSQAFKYSNTKIITPIKSYDPQNEFDEEYFEFGLFMSRREYKTINRRLQAGRLASVKDGKYAGNIPPYGYERIKIKGEKGFTLKEDPLEAETVSMIFDMYTTQNKGASQIANRLNELEVLTRKNSEWVTATILGILQNPVYIGKIRWNARKVVKRVENGEIIKSRPRADKKDITVVDGLHKAIIDIGTWELAQKILKSHSKPKVNKGQILTNPYAGLVVCGVCGRKMVRRFFKRQKSDVILCPYTSCANVSCYTHYFEAEVFRVLNEILKNIKIEVSQGRAAAQENPEIKLLSNIKRELAKVDKQMNSLHDFLEQGIYDISTFVERSKSLSAKKEKICADMEILKEKLNSLPSFEEKAASIPQIETAIDLFFKTDSPQVKNALLKGVIKEIIYTKSKVFGGRWHNDPKNFTVKLTTKF